MPATLVNAAETFQSAVPRLGGESRFCFHEEAQVHELLKHDRVRAVRISVERADTYCTDCSSGRNARRRQAHLVPKPSLLWELTLQTRIEGGETASGLGGGTAS